MRRCIFNNDICCHTLWSAAHLMIEIFSTWLNYSPLLGIAVWVHVLLKGASEWILTEPPNLRKLNIAKHRSWHRDPSELRFYWYFVIFSETLLQNIQLRTRFLDTTLIAHYNLRKITSVGKGKIPTELTTGSFNFTVLIPECKWQQWITWSFHEWTV